MLNSPLPLPVTLTTAAILTLIFLVLIFRTGSARGRTKVMMGDGGHDDMIVCMRTQANFIEYVPLIVILMGLLEMAKVSRLALMVMGLALIVARVLHIIGMPRPAPNIFRGIGAGVSALIMLICAVWGLLLVFTA